MRGPRGFPRRSGSGNPMEAGTGVSGLRKSLYLFAAFLTIWAPYRYLVGALGWRTLPSDPVQILVDSAAKLLVSFGLVYAFLKRYGDSWEDLGVSRKGLKESLALASVGSLSLTSVYLAAGGSFKVEPLGSLYLFLAVGPAEELLSRGYFFSMTAKDPRRGLPMAALFSSSLFALSHLPIDIFVLRMDPYGMAAHLLSVFLVGLILCYYFYSGWNLAGPSIVHSAVDFCSAYVVLESGTSSFLVTSVGMFVLAIIPPIWWLIRRLR